MLTGLLGCDRTSPEPVKASAADVLPPAPSPEAFCRPTTTDPVWHDTEKRILAARATITSEGSVHPSAYLALGLAYAERGWLREATNAFATALQQHGSAVERIELSPKALDLVTQSLPVYSNTRAIIDASLGNAMRSLTEMSQSFNAKGLSHDAKGNDLASALAQTRRQIATLEMVVEGKVRFYVGGPNQMLRFGGNASREWTKSVASYGSRVEFKDGDTEETIVRHLLTAKPTELPFTYVQIAVGPLKGAFREKAEFVIIPGVKYYEDVLQGR